MAGDVLRLPPGSQQRVSLVDDGGLRFAGAGGATGRTLVVPLAAAQADWQQKQENALEEYTATHEGEAYSPETQVLYRLFGGHIAAAVLAAHPQRRPRVLDVGCGIGKALPPYVRGLGDALRYVGLDPFEKNLARDYPFVCARLEDFAALPGVEGAFDLLLFSTSLDHFPDLDQVARAARRAVRPGGLLLFWVGLHDAGRVAQQAGRQYLADVFAKDDLRSNVVSLARLAALRLPRFLLAMHARRRKLAAGESLDAFHFHYFQAATLRRTLEAFGEIVDWVDVVGTNSVFVTCRAPAAEPLSAAAPAGGRADPAARPPSG